MLSTESENSLCSHYCYLIVKTLTIKPDQYDCWFGKSGIELYSKTIPTIKYVKTSIEHGASEDRGSS